MNDLRTKKKITLATLKSFARKNSENLYIRKDSQFSGMTDMVEVDRNAQWEKTHVDQEKTNYYATGIQGVYTVSGSGNYFNLYEDETYLGIEVYNCCGSCVLAIKK
jgi:hypothetical protein